MATLKEINLDSITFGESEAPLYDADLKFNADVPPIIRLAKEIENFLKKRPLIPLTCSFDLDGKTGERLFRIKDKRDIVHVFVNDWSCDVLKPKETDFGKLESILAKLRNVETITKFRAAYRVGASFVKLLILESAAYLEKYVDIKGKARFGRVVWHDIRYCVGIVMFGIFVITTMAPYLLPLV